MERKEEDKKEGRQRTENGEKEQYGLREEHIRKEKSEERRRRTEASEKESKGKERRRRKEGGGEDKGMEGLKEVLKPR